MSARYFSHRQHGTRSHDSHAFNGQAETDRSREKGLERATGRDPFHLGGFWPGKCVDRPTQSRTGHGRREEKIKGATAEQKSYEFAAKRQELHRRLTATLDEERQARERDRAEPQHERRQTLHRGQCGHKREDLFEVGSSWDPEHCAKTRADSFHEDIEMLTFGRLQTICSTAPILVSNSCSSLSHRPCEKP